MALSEDGQRSYSRLVSPYEEDLRAFVRGLTRSSEAAEDVAQESLILAHRNLSELRDTERVWPWLRTIAVRVARRYGKRERSRAGRRLVSDAEPDESALVGWVDGDGGPDALLEAITSMESRHRRLVAMKYLSGFSYEEIGAYTGLSHGQIAELLRSARDKLATALASGPGEPADVSECPWIAPRLGRLVSGELLLPHALLATDHVDCCRECREALGSRSERIAVSWLREHVESMATGDTAAHWSLQAMAERLPLRGLEAGLEYAETEGRRADDAPWRLASVYLAMNGPRQLRENAAEAARELVAGRPDEPTLTALLMEALSRAGGDTMALRDRAVRGAASGPDTAWALIEEARLALEAGAAHSAVTLTDAVLEAMPQHPGAWIVRGLADLRLGHPASAARSALRAVACSRGRPQLWAEAARILGSPSDDGPAAATRHAEHVLQAMPCRALGWETAAWAAVKSGGVERPLEYALHALDRADPCLHGDGRRLGFVLRSLSDEVEAAERTRALAHGLGCFEDAQERGAGYYVLGQVCRRLGHPRWALRCMTRAGEVRYHSPLEWVGADVESLLAQPEVFQGP